MFPKLYRHCAKLQAEGKENYASGTASTKRLRFLVKLSNVIALF